MPSRSPLWGLTAGVDSDVPQKWRIRRPVHRPVNRLGLLLASAATLALLVGSVLLVWVAQWYTPPRPISVVVIGAGYETNLTVRLNVYGWRSAQRVHAGENEVLQPVAPPFRLRTGEDWTRDLETISDSPVLLYFAMQGGADPAGPYLIRDDADTRMVDRNLLRVRAILARLAKMPANQVKILIFDATHQRTDPQRGMFWNDFSRALEELEPEIAGIPNLVVISASGPNERSWAIPEYGESAFGHFFRRALAGDIGNEPGDSIATLDEAYAITLQRVQNWARSNRNVNQRPMLLPSGEEGVRRAARVTLGPRSKIPDPMPEPPAPLPDDVNVAWTTAETFRTQNYPPSSYAPIQWRQYLQLLLRYEHLAEAGDHENAAKIRAGIRGLEEVFRTGPVDDLGSLALSLPMPAAIGLPVTPSNQARQIAEVLRDANPADAAKKWQGALATQAGNSRGETLLRLGVTQLLMESAAEDPGFRRTQVQPLLKLILPDVMVGPVEVTFLRILLRDLPTPTPPEDLLRQALETRLLAERVAVGSRSTGHGYAERVTPFTRHWVKQGDQARLPAQDLLLSRDPASLAEARRRLAEAKHAYQQGAQVANTVAQVFSTRDRIFLQLAFLSRSIAARQRPESPEELRRWEQSLTEAIAIWEETHRLDQDIRKASLAAEPHLLIAGFQQRAVDLRNRNDALLGDVLSRGELLCGVDLPSVWRDADDALSVPFLPADLRSRLLANKRGVSWRFLTQSKGDVLPPVSAPKMATWAVDESQRTGQLALAAVGKTRFDKFANSESDSYELTEFRLRTFPADPEGWKSRMVAGNAFVRRFESAPIYLARLVSDAAARTGDGPLEPLSEADSLARVLPASISPKDSDDPTAICRRAFLARLLTDLADRTWEEHWYSLDPADEPYYRRAGRLFLTDASANGNPDAIRTIRDKIDRPGAIAIGFPKPGVVVTTEATLQPSSTLGPGGDNPAVPTGWVVWRPDPGKGLGWAGTIPDPTPVQVAGKTRELVLPLRNEILQPAEENPPTLPDAVNSHITVHALFRGQRISNTLPVTIYPRPVVTENDFLPPRLASLAIRATPEIMDKFGETTGTVAFVVDCSGSMGPPEGEAYGPTTKFTQAITVFEKVLRDLPPGTTISVWAFGQAVGSGKTVEEAEKTITRVIAPMKWNPADTKATEALLKRVRYPALEPWNESPVLRAMLEAKADLTQATGYKSMIVLTDGADNRYAKDKIVNPNGKSVPDVIRDEFRMSGIAVHAIGFRLPKAEEDLVTKQFGVLKTLDPPGSFTPAEDVQSLESALRKALRRTVRFQILSPENVLLPGIPETGLAVGLPGGGDRWYAPGLKPGAEKVRILASPYLVKEVDLRAGDRLLLDLRNGPTGLQVGRAEYAANDYPGRPWVTARDWRLTLAQNQRQAKGMSSLLFMERRFDPAEQTLIQPRPKQTWFELLPAGDENRLPAVRWSSTSGYPATAWTLDSPQWPSRTDGSPARPVIKTWWNPDQEPRIATRFDAGIDFRNLGELTDRKLFIDGEPAQLLGVAIEEHIVDVGLSDRKRMACLAVRVAHAPANPVQVYVRGLGQHGRAAWFYPEAARSTTLFWPVDQETAKKLTALEFVSVRELKRTAEQRGFSASLRDVPAPDPADTRPPPPIALP